MSGLIPEDPGGLPLPFRQLHPTPPKAASPPKRREGKGRSWMAELLFENSVVAGPDPAADPAQGELAAAPRATRSQLLDGYIGEEPPKTFAAYRALLSELFDHKRAQLVQLLQKEPVFASALPEWNPRRSSGNANIARELTPYVVRGMEAAYDFGSAPIEYVSAAGFLGTYDMKHHKIQLTPALFAQPLKEFLDTLVHEEIHALQTEMMLMLNVQKKGRVLSPPERAIAQYWRNEEPKYRSALAAGSQMSPETKRRYRMIGQEYHAWTTGHFVGVKMTGG